MTAGLTTRNFRDGRLLLKDGDGTPTTREVDLLEGQISFSEGFNNIVVMDRGTVDHVRVGDDMLVEGSLTFKYVELYNASTGTVWQFLKQSGPFASLVSTRATDSDRFCFDAEFYIAHPISGSTGEKITFSDIFVNGAMQFREGEEYNTVTIPFKMLGTTTGLTKADYP